MLPATEWVVVVGSRDNVAGSVGTKGGSERGNGKKEVREEKKRVAREAMQGERKSKRVVGSCVRMERGWLGFVSPGKAGRVCRAVFFLEGGVAGK